MLSVGLGAGLGLRVEAREGDAKRSSVSSSDISKFPISGVAILGLGEA